MRGLGLIGLMGLLGALGPVGCQDPPATTTEGGSTGSTGMGTGTTSPTTTMTTLPTTTLPTTTMTSDPTTGTSTTGDTSSGDMTTTEGSTTGEAAPCCVAPDEPTSSVQAQTPVGSRALPWAVYGISGGECGGTRFLYLYSEAAGVEAPLFDMDGVDHLEITLSSYMDMWPDDFIGTGPAEVKAHFDGQSASIAGEITILQYDSGSEGYLWCDPEGTPVTPDAHISFTIALKADGWDIAGEVVADYCPALDKICP